MHINKEFDKLDLSTEPADKYRFRSQPKFKYLSNDYTQLQLSDGNQIEFSCVEIDFSPSFSFAESKERHCQLAVGLSSGS